MFHDHPSDRRTSAEPARSALGVSENRAVFVYSTHQTQLLSSCHSWQRSSGRPG